MASEAKSRPRHLAAWLDRVAHRRHRTLDRSQGRSRVLAYDDIFARSPLCGDVMEAFVKLGWNGLVSAASDLFGRTRGLIEVLPSCAGRPEWSSNGSKTISCVQRPASASGEVPTGTGVGVVAAHSLGSLICYDAFRSRDGQHALHDSVF